MNFPFCRSPIKGSKGPIGHPPPVLSHPILDFLSKPTESTKDRISTKNTQNSVSKANNNSGSFVTPGNNGPRVSRMLPDAFNLPQSPKLSKQPIRPSSKLLHFQNFTGKHENSNSSDLLENLLPTEEGKRKLTMDSEDSKKHDTAEYMLFDGKVKNKREYSSKRLNPNIGNSESKDDLEESPSKFQSQRVRSGEPFDQYLSKDEQKKNLVFLIKNGKVERKREKYRNALSPDFERNINPIRPVREFLKYQKSSENLSFRENAELANIFSTKAYSSKFKIQDMMTLEARRMGSAEGTIRKLIHAPTFKLFVSKELPLNSPKISNSLKEWEKVWKEVFQNSTRFVKFLEIFWNSPEGCATILYEYVPYGSLVDIVKQYINLPEAVIGDLANELLKAALEFQKSPYLDLQEIFTPKRILVTSLGTLRYIVPLPNLMVTSDPLKIKSTHILPSISYFKAFRNLKRFLKYEHSELIPENPFQCTELAFMLLYGVLGEELVEDIETTELFYSSRLLKECCIPHGIIETASSINSPENKSKTSLSSMYKPHSLQLMAAQLKSLSKDLMTFLCSAFSSKEISMEFLGKQNSHFELRHFSRRNVRWGTEESGDQILKRVLQNYSILSPNSSLPLKQKQLKELAALSEELGISEEAIKGRMIQLNFPH